jgi:hypothetical protein
MTDAKVDYTAQPAHAVCYNEKLARRWDAFFGNLSLAIDLGLRLF